MMARAPVKLILAATILLFAVALSGCHRYEPMTEEQAGFIIPMCNEHAPQKWTVYVSDAIPMGQAAQAFQERGWSNITAEYEWHNSVSAECPAA